MATPIEIRQVRLLIPDAEAVYGDTGNEYMFSEQDIEDFLALGRGSVKWAAGLAKITVGSSEALILKVIKNYETSTNGAVLMKEWVAAGEKLIAEGREDVADGIFGYFDIVFQDSQFDYPEGSNRPIGAPLHVSPPWGWTI